MVCISGESSGIIRLHPAGLDSTSSTFPVAGSWSSWIQIGQTGVCRPPAPHHGPHLRAAVLPLRAVLGRQPLPAPPPHPAHGQDDALQDLPGLPAQLPPDLQLCPLPRPPGQPRRAHLQVFSRKPGPGLSLQLCGERGLWAGGGEGAADRPARCG